MTEGTERSIVDRNIESVLNDVKQYCGIQQEQTDFDADICAAIDTTMSILYELGVVQYEKLRPVKNDSLMWTDFFDDPIRLSMAKSYIRAKVRLMFDPPASSTILNALQEQCSEFEWRAQIAAEYPPITKPE